MWLDGIPTLLFNFLIGAFAGAILSKILILKILNPLGLMTLSRYISPGGTNSPTRHTPTLVFSLLGGICGVHFNITKVPSLLLDSALAGNPLAIVSVGSIMVLCIIFLQGLLSDKNRR